MNSIARLAAATVAAAGLVLAGVAAAGVAQAEPRYHWCPGEQWSGWMGANWDANVCHDNHYVDLEPRDQAHWHGDGPYQPGWPLW